MVSINEQIKDAIQVMSHRRTVFTAGDIAAYANLEGAEKSICEVLQRQYGGLLNLDSASSTDPNNERYIRQINVERWWVRQTLRWADSRLNYLTEGQLASAISLAFSECRWSTPPEAVLQTGRRWAIVAEGCVPGTYVFPWASALRANPQLADTFRSILDPESEVTRLKNELGGTYHQYQWQRLRDDDPPLHLSQSAITAAVDAAVGTLNQRQADVIRCRFGLDAGHKATLEELGLKFGVTRERVRQVEKKGLTKLKDLPTLYCGFAVHFICSGGSLLISDSEMTPQWKLLSNAIGLETAPIPELGFFVVGADRGLDDYRGHLDSVDKWPDFTDVDSGKPIFESFQFLSSQDAMRLRAAEEEFLHMQRGLFTRPRMVYEALRSLGRAAHFHDIAEEANRLFPERQCSTHSWHASLQLQESLSLGIVWIGRKGMYGLEEQGYTRPTRDLFEAAASIVETRYAETGQPVPYDFVLRELSRERQDPDPASVNIALSINERLKSVGLGRFVPMIQATSYSLDASRPPYDFDAGFDAFLDGDDDV